VTILHVLEPFASGITTAVIAITGELEDYRHVVIHGSRNWVDSREQVKSRFPKEVSFIEWKSAEREISLSGDFKALLELTAILKSYKKTMSGDFVIHLHSSKAGFLGRLSARILGIKAVIYTPHCGAFLRTDISGWKRRMYRCFERVGGLFGGRLVGCGPSEAALYRGLGAMYRNACYVSNGVAPRRIRKQSAGLKSPGKRGLISFAGIVSFQKDPALWNAVAAGCAAEAKDCGFEFYWIGDGPESAKIDRNHTVLTGWKDPEAVADLLEKTAVYLSCSAWEGLPYGVLEAMNSGCALLLRDVPGNRDLVVPGENGRLFETQEEAVFLLKEMLSDPRITREMGKKSRALLEKSFNLKAMGEGYREIYSQAAGSSRAKSGFSGRRAAAGVSP
jgi:glycosyltransferase involved in cell wall biosynthesis